MRPRITILAAALLALGAACGDPAGPERAASIQFGQPELHLAPRERARLTLVTLDAFGRLLAGTPGTFRSENPAVADVDSAGWVVGVSYGTTRVTATSGELRAVTEVVVEPTGGARVRRFELVRPSPPSDWISMDLWPGEGTRELRFVAENAAGTSVCDVARVRIQPVEAGIVNAVRDTADPCRIRLAPLDGQPANAWTLLRAEVDGLSDSVWVSVTRTHYRFTFEPVQPYDRVEAGGHARYELRTTALAGYPLEGISVRFAADTVMDGLFFLGNDNQYDYRAVLVDARTNAAGVAEFNAPAATSSLVQYVWWEGRRAVGYGRPVLRARLAALGVQPGEQPGLEGPEQPHEVAAASPARIAVFGKREDGARFEWRAVAGDSVLVAPAAACAPGAPRWGEWAGAAVLDRFGNATPVLPVASAEAGAITSRAGPFLARVDAAGVEYEYLGGMRLEVALAAGRNTARVTFTSPGLAPLTVRVVRSASC
ncbi:MAG TPA: hypothetical protein VFJ16_16540 [Longimicrobium sp.]|nr:hypothetical protein [Longimicrobium sp.]